MSILNKAENAYLTILRLVVLAGAVLALISATILWASAVRKLLIFEPKNTAPVLVVPQNTPKLDAFLASKNPEINVSIKNFSQYISEVLQSDPETNKLRAFLMEKANTLPKQNQNAYFKSLAEFSAELLQKVAEQKALVAAAKSAGQEADNAPGFINLDAAVQWHLIQFAEIVDKNNAEIAQKQQERILAKAASVQELYIVAISFAACVFVVFLFIIIKIERNLRGISVIREANPAVNMDAAR